MNKKMLFSCIIALLFMSISICVLGADPMPSTYKFEVGIPGIVGQNDVWDVSDLPSLLKNLLFFLYVLGAIIAFVSLVYAGFQYITSQGNMAKTKDAMDRVYKAAIGLVILLSAYLILYTINPDLVQIPDNLFQSSERLKELDNPENIQSKGFAPNFKNEYSENESIVAKSIIQTFKNGIIDVKGETTDSVIDDIKENRVDPQLLWVIQYILGWVAAAKPAECGTVIIGPIMRLWDTESCHSLGKAFDIEIEGNGADAKEKKENTAKCHEKLKALLDWEYSDIINTLIHGSPVHIHVQTTDCNLYPAP